MRRADLPARLVGAAFTTADALDLGVTASRLRAKDLVTPFAGTRLPVADADGLVARLAALAARLPAGTAFSHETAARLLGAPLPRVLDTAPIHVARPAPGRAIRGPGIRGHVIAPELWYSTSAVYRDDGRTFRIPVTGALVTWLSLAESLDEDDLVAVADFFLTEGSFSAAAMHAAVAAWAGRRGASLRAAAAAAARWPVRSRPETRQRRQFVRAGLPEPLTNVEILDAAGNVVAESDHVWPDDMVLNEFDGEVHRTDARTFRRDIAKHELYRDLGWTATRSTAHDVFVDPNPMIARIARLLRAAGRTDIPPTLPRIPPAIP